MVLVTQSFTLLVSGALFASACGVVAQEESEADKALARCEAAGDAYAASQAMLEEAQANYEAERQVLKTAKEDANDLRQANTNLQAAEAECETGNDVRNELFQMARAAALDAAASVAGRGFARTGVPPAGVTIPNLKAMLDSEEYIRAYEAARRAVRQARERSQHGISARDRVNAASTAARDAVGLEAYDSSLRSICSAVGEAREVVADIERTIADEIQQETEDMRQAIRSLRQRVELDKELTENAIHESNRLREPGGPVCSWQFTE